MQQTSRIERDSTPAVNQLSMIVAVILFGYLVLPYLELPPQEVSFNLFGIELLLELQVRSLVALLLAGLAAVGANWLLSVHPYYHGQSLLLHAILPALTAWIATIPLSQVAFDMRWWGLFFTAAALLMAVFTAEYISLDPQDKRYSFATMGLTALSFGLYLFLAISMRGGAYRLIVSSSSLALVSFPITLRTLYLRTEGEWHWTWAVGISLVIAQVAIGMHYLPLSPILFAIIMVALAYALTDAAEAIIQEKNLRRVWIETGVIVLIMVVIGALLGRFLG
jgi:hypothetical protein